MNLPVASLGGNTLRPFWLAWLDWLPEPIRLTTLPGGLTFGPGETGDVDLDNHVFSYLPAGVAAVSEVTHSVGGAEQVAVTLLGVPLPDSEMLASLSRALWQGRMCRLWHGLHDGTGMEIAGYYTGFMVQCEMAGAPDSGGAVTVAVENYLASLSQPRGRTYQDQAIFDPGDQSAARIRAAANGVQGAAVGSGGGGGGRDVRNQHYQEY